MDMFRQSKLLHRIASSVAAASIALAGAVQAQTVHHATASLQTFLAVPVPIERTTFELVTLPESTSGLPGPTDYVALVASIDLPAGDRAKLLAQLPAYTASRDIQRAFVRPWLSPEQRAAFAPQAPATAPIAAYDASALVKRKVQRAFLIPAGPSLLLYVEYLAPRR